MKYPNLELIEYITDNLAVETFDISHDYYVFLYNLTLFDGAIILFLYIFVNPNTCLYMHIY